ncbi:MAG: 3-hydroxyacyl-ACP dehydratase FabZ family protein [Pseudomonadota bacterium]
MNETRRLLAEWTPNPDEPVFAGHFPGDPLLPGGMLLDRVVATLASELGCATKDLAVRQARFLAPARPGVPLSLEQGAARGGRWHLRLVARPADDNQHAVLDLLVEPAAGPAGTETS